MKLSKNIRKIGCTLSIVIMLGGLGAVLYDGIRDAPETPIGFSETEQGYVIDEHQIPTKGDVVEIEKIAGEEYKKIELDDGRIKYEGKFRYKIRSLEDIDPKTPYLTDIRDGSVTLEKKTMRGKIK